MKELEPLYKDPTSKELKERIELFRQIKQREAL